MKACGVVTGGALKRNRFIGRNDALPCQTGFFHLRPPATSRVGLTLNANLLPGKVVFPRKGDAAGPATNGIAPHFASVLPLMVRT